MKEFFKGFKDCFKQLYYIRDSFLFNLGNIVALSVIIFLFNCFWEFIVYFFIGLFR